MNLFAVLDQTAARHGERGAVFLGERLVQTWDELRDRALRIATSIRGSQPAGARIAVASENRPEIVELMFAAWAAECAVVPINYKLHVLEMGQILDDSGATRVFASPRIAAGLGTVTAVPIETIGSPGYENRFTATPLAAASRHRPGGVGVVVLHQRNHGTFEGSDAVAPQPDGDDGRASGGLR